MEDYIDAMFFGYDAEFMPYYDALLDAEQRSIENARELEESILAEGDIEEE